MNKLRLLFWRVFRTLTAVYILMVVGCASCQRSALYFPTHHDPGTLLAAWKVNGIVLGYVAETKKPPAIWLMLHGNAGQASDREYALPCFPAGDTVYIIEYPGYGLRPGSPSKTSMNAAADDAFRELRKLYPGKPICVLGESIGSGPAAYLCTLPQPPEKITLVVPFDQLVKVASEKLPFLPIGLMLRDRWDNAESLRDYRGPIEIFGAENDVVIPVKHAIALANSLPRAKFHLIGGGHNEWSYGEKVRLTDP